MTNRYSNGKKKWQTESDSEQRLSHDKYLGIQHENTSVYHYGTDSDDWITHIIDGEEEIVVGFEFTALTKVSGKPDYKRHLRKPEVRLLTSMSLRTNLKLAKPHKIPFYIIIPNKSFSWFCVARVTSSKLRREGQKVPKLKWKWMRSEEHMEWLETYGMPQSWLKRREQLKAEIEKEGYDETTEEELYYLHLDVWLRRQDK